MCEICDIIREAGEDSLVYDCMQDLTIEQVVAPLAQEFGVDMKRLRGLGTLKARRNHCHDSDEVNALRTLAMYLVRVMTRASLPAIGEYFGKRHHTTVLSAIRRTERTVVSTDEGRAVIARAVQAIVRTLPPIQLHFPFIGEVAYA
jgi:chromosomal replication initiation ATPase DnaA